MVRDVFSVSLVGQRQLCGEQYPRAHQHDGVEVIGGHFEVSERTAPIIPARAIIVSGAFLYRRSRLKGAEPLARQRRRVGSAVT
jgi:hypothetical protein